jgi:hypothetical protein
LDYRESITAGKQERLKPLNLKTVDQAACPNYVDWERNKRPFFGFEEGYSLPVDFHYFPNSEARICDLSFEAFGIDGERLDAFGSSSEKRVCRNQAHYNGGKRHDWRLRVPIR